MPAKSTVGGNALAKRLAYLTVADNEAGKSEELGLEAAQAQEEDARRAMAEKRKEAQKIEQQKLRQQAMIRYGVSWKGKKSRPTSITSGSSSHLKAGMT